MDAVVQTHGIKTPGDRFQAALAPDGGLSDSLFLCLIVSLSVVLYVGHLGFYSDDWSFLETLSFSNDQSLPGLFKTFFTRHHTVWTRPVQGIYQALLYWLFGFHPLAYHLVNSAVLLSGILLFYWVLRELCCSRYLAVSLPAVYAMLPHYSTDRLWMAAFMTTLSMPLCLANLYSDLRIIRTEPGRVWRWKCISLASLLGSALAYEVFLPLLCVNPFIVLYRQRQANRRASRTRKLYTLSLGAGSNWLTIVLAVAFKVLTTDRTGGYGNRFIDFISHAKYLTKGALKNDFGVYGVALPRTLYRIAWRYPNVPIFLLAAFSGVLIFLYLRYLARREPVDFPDKVGWLKLIGLGLIIEALGYAVFLATSQIGFSPSGVNNRVAIAAAIGVACALVGSAGWISRAMKSKYAQTVIFSTLIAAVCAAGFLINNTIASFWTAAYSRQQAIVSDIRQHVPVLPKDSTMLLDGVCPYLGPGVVLESDWEVTGIVNLLYRNQTHLRADVVKPGFMINPDGITIPIYGDRINHPYQGLFVYHVGEKTIYPLTDSASAHHYFAKFKSVQECPSGREGFGVTIF